jgi:hypothetical protein
MLDAIVRASIRHRIAVLWGHRGGAGRRRSIAAGPAHRRGARHHQRAGAGAHRLAGALRRGGRALRHPARGDGPQRPAQPPGDPLGDPRGDLRGDHRLQRRHRRVVRAAARDPSACGASRPTSRRSSAGPSSRRCPRASGRSTSSSLRSDRHSAMELRTMLEWDVAPRLRSVPGVIEVNALGGARKQYEVARPAPPRGAPDHHRPVLEVLSRNNANVGGGWIERGAEQFTIRGEASCATLRTSRRGGRGRRTRTARPCRSAPRRGARGRGAPAGRGDPGRPRRGGAAAS